MFDENNLKGWIRDEVRSVSSDEVFSTCVYACLYLCFIAEMKRAIYAVIMQSRPSLCLFLFTSYCSGVGCTTLALWRQLSCHPC